MADEKSLELRSLIRRFTDSTEALDGLNERMKSLSATAETLTRTNTGVSEMSEQMRKFVEETSRLVILLSGAIEKVQSAVEKSVNLLDGEDLSDVKKSLAQIQALLESQQAKTQVELEQAKVEVANLSAQLVTLQTNTAIKLGNLPAKIKRKYWD